MNQIKELQSKCENSVITLDSSALTQTVDITNMEDNCHIVYSVDRSALSGLKGTSMTCDIPMSKTALITQSSSIELLKYCEGSMKDKFLELIQQMWGFR